KQKETTVYNEQTKYFEYPIRLGRFEETITTTMNPTVIDGIRFELYKTIKGNISLAINKTVKQETKTQINYLSSKKNKIVFKGKLFTRNQLIEEIELVVIGRENNVDTRFKLSYLEHLQNETIRNFGLNRYKFKVNLDLNELFKNNANGTD